MHCKYRWQTDPQHTNAGGCAAHRSGRVGSDAATNANAPPPAIHSLYTINSAKAVHHERVKWFWTKVSDQAGGERGGKGERGGTLTRKRESNDRRSKTQIWLINQSLRYNGTNGRDKVGGGSIEVRTKGERKERFYVINGKGNNLFDRRDVRFRDLHRVGGEFTW